ncbi:MAG: YqaJ viral recombinase family protein, partial [Bacteroidales bacterium]|nr:YqaJ viral recombinase family protein [Bacteroidales bacterium]
MKCIKWLDNSIGVDLPKKLKKISGTYFPTVLGFDPWKTPFEAWCKSTRTWESPFEGNKYTNAGEIIEPKVFDFLRYSMGFGSKVTTPTDVYGKDYFKKTWGDFFPESKTFSGMWDCLIKDENGNTEYVVEIKTVQVDGRSGSLEDRWKDGEAP